MYQREKEFLLKRFRLTGFKGAMLAGGALTSVFTNRPIKDFDVYFKTKQDFLDAVAAAYEDGMWCVSLTDRCITFALDKDIYQYMYFRFFPTAEDIFASFDFTCCMAAIDLESNEFTFHPSFFSDTSKRELVFNHGTAFPLASGLRVAKYQEKGFTIPKLQLLKLMTAVNFKTISSWEEFQAQIGGTYGECVALAKDKEFSLANAIEALDSAAFTLKTEKAVPPNYDSFAGVYDAEVLVPDPGMPLSSSEAIDRLFPNDVERQRAA